MRNIISLLLLFSSVISQAQQELPSGAIQKLNRSKDSLQLTVERKSSLLSVRNAARSEQKNVLVLSSSGRKLKEQDALYLGDLEKKSVYKVSVPAIVSKYAGETEKNLDKLFANAAAKQYVLFFDGADQLFSRSSQPESTARYIEKLAMEKKVLTIFWCEEDCLKWLGNSKYVSGQ